MLKIEYEIKLNNSGRPCIDLSEDYVEKPEDKFFAIELTRYVIQNIYNNRKTIFDSQSANAVETSIAVLGQIGDEMAAILWRDMENMGDIAFMLNSKYHIQVKTIEERDNLCHIGILSNNKIFKRQEGLRVLVTDDNMKIYVLCDGIENKNWKEIN